MALLLTVLKTNHRILELEENGPPNWVPCFTGTEMEVSKGVPAGLNRESS